MSRLTERTRYGIVGNNDRVINYPLYKIAGTDPLDRRIVGQCFEKLAQYEDAEEQCIKETTYGFKELLYKWKVFLEDMEELLEYRRLEEQGLLIKVPCKAGDTVYEVLNTKMRECRVDHIDAYDKTVFVHLRYSYGSVYQSIDCFGKTVFLTKEEAEKKLASMQKGE